MCYRSGAIASRRCYRNQGRCLMMVVTQIMEAWMWCQRLAQPRGGKYLERSASSTGKHRRGKSPGCSTSSWRWWAATGSTPSGSWVRVMSQGNARRPGDSDLRLGCQAGADCGVGGRRQDLRQETEDRTTQHGGVPGKTRTSRLGPRCQRAAVLCERVHHRPAAETGEGESRKSQGDVS